MYDGLRAPDTLHKKPCPMGLGLSRTSENFASTHFVKKGKKKGQDILTDL
jgi:hypothetical protein